MNSAKEMRMRAEQRSSDAMDRLRGLIDARQQYLRDTASEAERKAFDRAIERDMMVGHSVADMTKAGSALGPYGAAAGAVLGSVLGAGKVAKATGRLGEKKGWSKAKIRREKVKNIFNPAKHGWDKFFSSGEGLKKTASVAGSLGKMAAAARASKALELASGGAQLASNAGRGRDLKYSGDDPTYGGALSPGELDMEALRPEDLIVPESQFEDLNLALGVPDKFGLSEEARTDFTQGEQNFGKDKHKWRK